MSGPRRGSANAAAIRRHLSALAACRRCPKMESQPVYGEPVASRVILVGQAPGTREPLLRRPFAWTAGRTMFKWFAESAGVDEATFRASIYMAAVCRCFPGKSATGGDRVPAPDEIGRCADWLEREIKLLRPGLVIPVGKLAISRFLPPAPLGDLIGKRFQRTLAGVEFDLIPLPHPSGASPWHRIEPGKSLLHSALKRIAKHPAFLQSICSTRIDRADERP